MQCDQVPVAVKIDLVESEQFLTVGVMASCTLRGDNFYLASNLKTCSVTQVPDVLWPALCDIHVAILLRVDKHCLTRAVLIQLEQGGNI